MTFSHNSLHLTKEAQQMANKADHTNALVFQKVAMVSMIVMAAAGATRIMLQVMRELRREPDKVITANSFHTKWKTPPRLPCDIQPYTKRIITQCPHRSKRSKARSPA